MNDYEELEQIIDNLKPNLSHLSTNMTSDYIMDRSMNAIFYGDEPRLFSEIGTVKTIADGELAFDGLSYFEKVKEEIQKDFFDRLIKEIGLDKAKYFCMLIKDYWFVGSKRTSKKITELKNGIRLFLTSQPLQKKVYVINNSNDTKIGLITPEDIRKIINLNEEMFDLYIQEWISTTNCINDKNTNNLYFRRGLTIDKLDNEYFEFDYINSYSISATVAEQFSTMTPEPCTLIVNGEYGLYCQRILFFSLFIPDMNIRQFEVGIIPHTMPLHCKKIGSFHGIEEYKIQKAAHLN